MIPCSDFREVGYKVCIYQPEISHNNVQHFLPPGVTPHDRPFSCEALSEGEIDCSDDG